MLSLFKIRIMRNKEMLKNYKDDDLAIDAERTSDGIMFSETDVFVLMSLANTNLLNSFITRYNSKPKSKKGYLLSINDVNQFLKDWLWKQ